MGMSETGFTDFTRPKYSLLEFILSSANLNAAYNTYYKWKKSA